MFLKLALIVAIGPATIPTKADYAILLCPLNITENDGVNASFHNNSRTWNSSERTCEDQEQKILQDVGLIEECIDAISENISKPQFSVWTYNNASCCNSVRRNGEEWTDEQNCNCTKKKHFICYSDIPTTEQPRVTTVSTTLTSTSGSTLTITTPQTTVEVQSTRLSVPIVAGLAGGGLFLIGLTVIVIALLFRSDKIKCPCQTKENNEAEKERKQITQITNSVAAKQKYRRSENYVNVEPHILDMEAKEDDSGVSKAVDDGYIEYTENEYPVTTNESHTGASHLSENIQPIADINQTKTSSENVFNVEPKVAEVRNHGTYNDSVAEDVGYESTDAIEAARDKNEREQDQFAVRMESQRQHLGEKKVTPNHNEDDDTYDHINKRKEHLEEENVYHHTQSLEDDYTLSKPSTRHNSLDEDTYSHVRGQPSSSNNRDSDPLYHHLSL